MDFVGETGGPGKRIVYVAAGGDVGRADNTDYYKFYFIKRRGLDPRRRH